MKKELKYLAGTDPIDPPIDPMTDPAYQQYMKKLDVLKKSLEDFQNELYMLNIHKPSPKYAFAAKKVADKLQSAIYGLEETKAELEYYLDYFAGE